MNQPVAKVCLPIALGPLDYLIPETMAIQLNQLVVVPFRRAHHIGWVTEIIAASTVPILKLRSIESMLPASLSTENRDFITWLANYTVSPQGLVFKMYLGGIKQPALSTNTENSENKPSFSFQPLHLNTEQKSAATQLETLVKNHSFAPLLLEGVTGSGKTEVYFQALQTCLEAGKNALILLPEINLTAAWLARFESCFGFKPIFWHSHMTPKQRQEAWLKINAGTAVVVGTRSALCLPHQNLGLIVVDEEHDASYKQESLVRYHARDMAVRRAQLASCPIILTSATPSVETIQNVHSGKYQYMRLTKRYGPALMPTMHPIDLKQEILAKEQSISPTLWQALEGNYERGEQSLLFLNRRGYAPIAFCQSCRTNQTCKKCDVNLVYHKHTQALLCHHCGYQRKASSACGQCSDKEDFLFFGVGVEKLVEEIKEKHPDWPLLLMTSDTLSTPKKMKQAFDQIESGEARVIIATQTMAKGHHFPNLTLVGVVDATLGPIEFDLRTTERSFQLLHQVAGRCGRADKPGHVYLQTFAPDHPAFMALCQNDGQKFYKTELEQRQRLSLPPFGRLTALIVEGAKEKEVKQAAMDLLRCHPKKPGVQILGPTPAPLTRLKKLYRWRFLVKSNKATLHTNYLQEWLSNLELSQSIRITVDVDPYSFS
ncbi:MAG: primosomal protein N' [Rickettsiales bacterium]|nr:primosomal protein N' [Rickettsiales bacterium]|tara:strand:+ start:3598 stop:5571 length:1974 start_codon:yes stop_codon:yes gene_type:complete